MTQERAPAVAAIVLAARGGVRLARALDSVAWADERLVLDPAGVANASLPAGVRRVRAAAAAVDLARADWLLLLHEDEVAPPALAAAVAAAVAAPSAPDAYRVPREVRGFGIALRPLAAPVRLARRLGSGLRLTDLGAELVCATGATGRVAAPLVVAEAGSLAEAVDDLDADGSVLAALLRAQDVRPGIRRAGRAALAAATRLLTARTVSPRDGTGWRWARWSLAVLAGYRALLAYAKLWERHLVEASTPG